MAVIRTCSQLDKERIGLMKQSTRPRGGVPLSSKAISVLLSVTLAFGYGGNPLAYADPVTGSAQSSSVATDVAAQSSQTQDVATTSEAAAAATQTSDAQVQASDAAKQETDIAKAWADGGLVISEGGTYYLSADVEASQALVVSVPEGEQATIDFRGHTATVTGAVEAGIDVSASRGEVSIVDTEYKPSAKAISSDKVESDVPLRLIVEANKVLDSISGVRVAPEVESTIDAAGAKAYKAAAPKVSISNIGIAVRANTADASSASDAEHSAYGVYAAFVAGDAPESALDGAKVDVTLDNCFIEAKVNEISVDADKAAALKEQFGEQVIDARHVGPAVGVYAAVPGVTFKNTLAFDLVSSAATCGLYAAKAESFTLGEGFALAGETGVFAASNAEGVVFATVSEGADKAKELAGSFNDATAAGMVVSAKDSALVFAKAQSNADSNANALVETPEAISLDDEPEALDDEIEAYGDDSESGAVADDREIIGPDKAGNGVVCLNLNELWTTTNSQYRVVVESKYNVTNATTYAVPSTTTKVVAYLTGDLDVSGTLLFYLSNSVDVELYLNGYAITGSIAGSQSKDLTDIATKGSVVSATQVKSLTINGTDKSGKYRGAVKRTTAQTVSNKQGSASTISLSAQRATLNVNDVDVVNAPLATKGAGSGAGIAVSQSNVAGVSISNCKVTVDYSADGVEQYAASSSWETVSADANSVVGIYSATSNIVISNTQIEAKHKDFDVATAVGVDLPRGGSFESGSISASAANGSAIGVRTVSSASIGVASEGESSKPDVMLNVSGGSVARGISFDSTDSKIVALDGGIGFSGAAADADATAVGLYAAKSGAFTIGSSFKAFGASADGSYVDGSLPAYIGIASDDVNSADTLIAKWASGFTPSAEAQAKIAGMFSNASSNVPTVVSANDTGVQFSLDEESSAIYVQVLYAGESEPVKYSSVAEAARAIDASANAAGATIQLISDVPQGGLTLTNLNSLAVGTELTLDLNGHDIEYLNIPAKFSKNGSNVDNFVGCKLTVLDNSKSEKGSFTGALSSGTSASTIAVAATAAQVVIDGVDIVPNAATYATYNPASGVISVTGATKTVKNSQNENVVLSAGIELRNLDFSVVAQSASGTAYGIVASATASVTLDNCNFELSRLQNQAATGFSNMLNLTVNDSIIKVSSSSVVGTTGVAPNAAANVSMTNSSLTVAGAGTTGCKGFSSGKTLSFENCTFDIEDEGTNPNFISLTAKDNSVTFAGAINLKGNGVVATNYPIVVDSSFKLSDGSSKISVKNTSATDKDVFAKAASEGSDITGFEDAFEVNKLSYYNGFEIVYVGEKTEDASDDDESQLAWYHAPVAKNVSTGIEYSKLSVAISSMNVGDTIELLEDATEVCVSSPTGPAYAPLQIKKSGTLDLAGHTALIDLSTATSTQNLYAVNINSGTAAAPVDFVITDSSDSNTGSFNVNLARSVTGSALDAAGKRIGINVQNNASLTVDEASVNVEYNQNSASVKQGTTSDVYGINANGNNSIITLGENAVLSTVASASDGGSYSLNNVTGITSMSATTYKVFMDESATVNVRNDVSAQWSSNAVYGSSSASSASSPYLIKQELSKGSDFYEAVQSAFAVQAKYDEQSGRYYAFPAKLDDGSLVWAVSDKVASDKFGEASAIVASECWVQSQYQTLGMAKGIQVSKGTYDLAGTINISGSETHAAAVVELSASNTPAINVGDLTINVSAGSGLYRGVSAASTSSCFEDIYGMKKDGAGTQFRMVGYLNPYSYGIYSTSNASTSADTATKAALINLNGELSVSTSGDNAIDIASHSYIAYGDKFAAGGDGKLSVYDPGTGANNDIGKVDSKAGNVEGFAFAKTSSGDAATAQDAAVFTDADGDYQAIVNDNGNLSWSKNLCSVTFVADGITLDNYTHDSISYGTTIDLPSEAEVRHSESPSNTYSYEFLGWSSDKDATADDFGTHEGDIARGATSLVVTSSATYYAVYKQVATERTVTFTNLRNSDGSAKADISLTANYGQTLGDALAAAGKADAITSQKSYTDESGTWEFVGWRMTGYETQTLYPSYDMGTNVKMTTSNYSAGKTNFTAVYLLVGKGQHLVSFRSDGTVHAYVADNGATPSIDAMLDANQSTVPLNVEDRKSVVTTRSTLFANSDKDHELVGFSKGNSSDSTYSDEKSIDYKVGDTLPASNAAQSFTMKFEEKTKTATVSAISYRQVTNTETGELVWGRVTDKIEGVEYGTDPIELANESVNPTSFIKTNDQGVREVYTFIGWSTRKDDKSPISGWEKDGSLPAMSSTGLTGESHSSDPSYVIYAIYSVETLSAKVNFNVDFDDGAGYVTYATTSEGVDATTNVNDAFATTGSAAPERSQFNFLGWSKDKDATGVGVLSVGDVIDALDAAGKISDYGDITVDVYSVFEAKGTHSVVFYNDPDDLSQTYTVTLSDGDTVASTGKAPANPSQKAGGTYFAGWVMRTGEGDSQVEAPFSMDAPVSASMNVYATFKPITVEADEETSGTGATVDVSKMFLTSDEFTGAESVVVKLRSLIGDDKNLSNSAATPARTNMPVKSYNIQVEATFEDGSTKVLTSDFGTATVKVPVDAKYAENKFTAFKLLAPGDVKFSDGLSASGGFVSFPVTQYAEADSVNNLSLVAIRTEAELKLYDYKAEAKEKLEKVYNGYREADYSKVNFEKLQDYYYDGVLDVEACTTVEDVQKAYTDVVNKMAGVSTLNDASGIASAKAQYLEGLAMYYASLSRSSYSDDVWLKIENAYSDAKSAVSSAQSAELAASAYNTGLDAISELAKNTSNGSSTQNNSGSSASGLSGGSNSKTTASASGLSGSSSGSGSSTGSGSGLSADGSDADGSDGGSSLLSAAEDASDLLVDDGDSAKASSSASLDGVGAWVGAHWVFFVILPLILLAIVIGFLWYVLAHRRNSEDSDLDLPQGSAPSVSV